MHRRRGPGVFGLSFPGHDSHPNPPDVPTRSWCQRTFTETARRVAGDGHLQCDVGAASPPTANRAQGAKRAVPVELLRLRDDANGTAAHAIAMALRQAVGQALNGATCAGASPPDSAQAIVFQVFEILSTVLRELVNRERNLTSRATGNEQDAASRDPHVLGEELSRCGRGRLQKETLRVATWRGPAGSQA